MPATPMKPLKPVSVAVRCRMILPHDRDQRSCVQVLSDRDIQCLDPEHLHAELREKHGRVDYLKENHCRERAYTFDAAFGPSATNSMLFEKLAAPLVPQVLEGRHGTCFAYGMTGSGKTHTMLGRQGEAGIVERVLQLLLSEAASIAGAKVSITFVEVYNEKIRDLLQAKCPALELREDALRGPSIAGVRELPANTTSCVMDLVREGNARRSEERTAANPVSSRSHAVLQLIVETPLPGSLGKKKRCAKLSLIDLAGSERAANTGNRGARLREGAMINRSLLALANCITALTRKGAYVNYRDSKLTRLLKDSLSGNCYTMMIAHVSPSITAFEETLNTLKYAHRACEIRGMCGGVRENVCDVAKQYADRMRPMLDAAHGLKQAMTQLLVPQPMPAAKATHAVQLADELEVMKTKLVSKMRKRIQVEQTALELDDQNQCNAIELSKLELEALGGDAEDVGNAAPGQIAVDRQQRILTDHIQLLAATKKNSAQRRHMEQLSAAAAEKAKFDEDEARFVALLADAKKIIEDEDPEVAVEKRLLQAQHAVALLEIEKVEAEQARVVLEAAARQHSLALDKQRLQLDVHARALAAAEALLAGKGLLDEWHSALGPLAKLLPHSSHAPGPSLDELIAEVSCPTTPVGSRPGTASRAALLALDKENKKPSNGGDDKFERINEDFKQMRATLSRSGKLGKHGPSADAAVAGSHVDTDEEDEEGEMQRLPDGGLEENDEEEEDDDFLGGELCAGKGQGKGGAIHKRPGYPD
eukprot:TRINITY_DN24182_c1_g1_i1.p1 TRINITY_DN24182_c1_g1~~TRINITY_DN24182_c1_g1_i1.p1  ORF type:complete len:762 (+),score=183.34 TRINITY_DN24182_c1_g1_i1:145-2430(+)